MTEELGVTIKALPDIGDRLELISGQDALAQAISFRLNRQRGTLWRYPNYGFDVKIYSSKALTRTDKFRLESAINQEVLKDERVYRCTTIATLNQQTEELTIELSLLTKNGPFKLVLLANETTLAIIENERNV